MNKRIESAKYEAVLYNAHRRSAQALENAVAHENRMMKNTTLQVVYIADGTASVEVV